MAQATCDSVQALILNLFDQHLVRKANMETLSEPRICGSEEDLVDYVYLYLKDSRRLGFTEATDTVQKVCYTILYTTAYIRIYAKNISTCL